VNGGEGVKQISPSCWQLVPHRRQDEYESQLKLERLEQQSGSLEYGHDAVNDTQE
jgi:hypothetical protein